MIRPVRSDGTIETGGPFVPIRRTRVAERIASAATQRIALIVAPAGYGKSVALRQYLEMVDRPCVRYDVRTEHRELLGFLRGFCDALGDRAPYARAALAGAYDRNAGSSSPGFDLALWMHTHLEAFRGLIAIDDLHVAQGEREVTRFITSLIERTKGCIDWIIASRTTQGLPIGTWLAYGESDLSIDEHDLRFTIDEAKDAARSCRLSVREEELHDLLQLTDGWPTAVSFALRTSTRSVDLRQTASTTRDMIYGYLAEQVYAGLTEEERNFLESAALLGEIEPVVMVAAGFDRAVAIVEDIRSRVAFLNVDVDGIYRCHDLFRDFLLHQMKRRGEAVAKNRREELAATLERVGRKSASLRMYIEAGSIANVQRILGIGFDLLEEGQGDLVLAALVLLEADPSTVTPVAAALRGVAQIAEGRYEDGERRLSSSLALLSDASIFSRVALKLAMLCVNRLRDPTSILERIFSRVDAPFSTVIEARSIMAVYRARTAEPGDALAYLLDVKRECFEITDDGVRARLLQRLGVASNQLQRGADACLMLEESARLADICHLWSVKSRALNSLAAVLMYANYDTGAALQCSYDAAVAARKAGDFLDLQTSLLMTLMIEVRRGNDARVRDVERELVELRASDRAASIFVISSQAYRAVWEGRAGDAHRLLVGIVSRLPREADRAISQSLIALCLAMDDRSVDAREAVDATLALIDAANIRVDSMDSLYFEIARLFGALSEILSGRHTSAIKILRRTALATDAVARAVHACVESLERLAKSPQYEATEIRGNLDVLYAHGFGGYARFLDIAQEFLNEKQSGGMTVKLTGAERRVLRDIADGLTPKDIASEMGRSVLTIQTHIKNIIEKLGCRGRAEAISTARRLGLLN